MRNLIWYLIEPGLVNLLPTTFSVEVANGYYFHGEFNELAINRPRELTGHKELIKSFYFLNNATDPIFVTFIPVLSVMSAFQI